MAPEIAAELELVVEDSGSGFCGAVVEIDRVSVTLEDRHGKRRVFPYSHPAFTVDGKRVRLTRPKAPSPVRTTRTASGSKAVPPAHEHAPTPQGCSELRRSWI